MNSKEFKLWLTQQGVEGIKKQLGLK